MLISSAMQQAAATILKFQLHPSPGGLGLTVIWVMEEGHLVKILGCIFLHHGIDQILMEEIETREEEDEDEEKEICRVSLI